MTTVEKLLVQIFDRKNWIIEQVKQQTEFYNQHLASKLLVDGITPPSWLWSPAASSDSKELNKEELISKLLRSYPQPSVHFSSAHYPLYNNPVITGDNHEFSNGYVMETCNNGLIGRLCPTVPATSSNEHAECALNFVPEPDVSVTSPENQTDEMVSNIYDASDQSLARIQRSKSRQKALELRNSARSLDKSTLGHENFSDILSSRIRMSISATEQACHRDEPPKLAEPCVTSSQSYKGWDLDEADCQSKDNCIDIYSGRNTRSRSSVKIQDSGRTSSKLGHSSDDKKDVSFHEAKVGKIVSDSEPADYFNKLPQSAGSLAAFRQSNGDRKLDGAVNQSREREVHVYSGRITRSKSSGKHQICACDSLGADIFSDDAQRIDNTPMDSGDDLCIDHIDGSLVKVNPSDARSEGWESPGSILEDCKSHKEKGAVVFCGAITRSWSSSQRGVCADDTSHLGTTSPSDKAQTGIVPPSSGRSAVQVDVPNDELGLVKTSSELVLRVSRLENSDDELVISEPVNGCEIPCCGGTMSSSMFKQNSSANDEVHNNSDCESIPPCYETHEMLDEPGNVGVIMANEHELHNLVDQSVSLSSNGSEQKRELESLVALVPSDCFVLVEPKLLDFNEIEEDNSKNFTSSSQQRKINGSSRKMSDHSAFLDKGIPDGVNHMSLHKQTSEKSEVSDKGEGVHRDSVEYEVQKHSETWTGKFVSVLSEHTTSKSSHDNTEAGINCFGGQDTADITLSNMIGSPNSQFHRLELHVEQGQSLVERHIEEVRQSYEGHWIGEGNAKNSLVSHASGSKNIRQSCMFNSAKKSSSESHDCLHGKIKMANSSCVDLDKIMQSPAQESQILSCIDGKISSRQADLPLGETDRVTTCKGTKHGEELSLERRSGPANLESWPQVKRRKIEDRQTNSFSTCPTFMEKTRHSIRRDSRSRYLTNMEVHVNTIWPDAFDVKKSTDVEMGHDKDCNLTKGIESTFECQNGEVGNGFMEQNESKDSSSAINNEQLGLSLVSSLTKKKAIASQGCFEEMRILQSRSNHFDGRESGDGQFNQSLYPVEKNTDNLNSENLTIMPRMLHGTESSQLEDDLHSQCYIPPKSEDLEFAAQSMPVFEGFIVDAEADGELDMAADGIDFDKLSLPRTTMERASILAEICRSASMNTPLSHFSSALNFQGTLNPLPSLSNSLPEYLDHRICLPLNAGVDRQLGSGNSFANDNKSAFEKMSCSDCLPYSSAQYDWNSRIQLASPVEKLWERLSSHAGSSGKRTSSNPYLTCFPIEEDPCVSEDKKTVDEIVDEVEEENESLLANHYNMRLPLKNLTNLGPDPPASVSPQQDILTADTHDKVQRSPKSQYWNYNETRENQTFSLGDAEVKKNQNLPIGAIEIKKAKESIKNSISKSILSSKTSLRRQEQKLSLKDSRRNNIVSNVSSFIPLVQQKKAAAECAGKREVKVKALGAAEAAKRIEEKRENERKKRKEALKLERAKLEVENLRQMELEKKRKEEERKKKDADIIAKKRLREEEERKEKEKKRMRLEARQRQREQEEKMRADKAEKEKQRTKDEQINGKKGSYEEFKRQQNQEIVVGDDIASKKTETKLIPAGVAMNYEECATSGDSFEAGKAMHTVDKSPQNEDLIIQKRQGKSYEISPYQCSDDDEEDDELPTKKYIPSWASKCSVALLLSLQHEMDPDAIFPPESFCSMDEVLLPRKLQQKQVAP